LRRGYRILTLVLLSLLIIPIITVVNSEQGLAKIFPADVSATRTASPDNRWVTVDLPYASFMANLWNLAGGAQGTMDMKITPTGADVYGSWSNLPTEVRVQGGPGIRYGKNIWGGNPPAHPLYRIPKKVTDLPYAIFFANYTVYEEESTLPITVTLFLWTVKAVRDGGTKAGDVLIIVRPYRHPGAPLTSPPLLNVTAPIIVNNSLVYAEFGVYAGNLDRSADTHTTITFELLAPIKSGRVGIPIPEFISLAANVLPQLRPDLWTPSDVLGNTLQMIDFVFEWYSNPQGEGTFKWSLYEVSFLVGANVVLNTVTTTVPTTITNTITSVIPTTIVSTNTVTATTEKTVVQTVTSTTTSVKTVSTTVTETSIETTTLRTTATVFTTVTTRLTTKVTETNWAIVGIVAIVLLLVGIGVGYMIKKPK